MDPRDGYASDPDIGVVLDQIDRSGSLGNRSLRGHVSTLLTRLPEYRCQFGHVVLYLEVLQYRLARLLPESLAHGLVDDQSPEGIGQAGHVALLDDQACLPIVHEFWNARHRRSDNRELTGHRLHQCYGHSIPVSTTRHDTGQSKDVSAPTQLKNRVLFQRPE